MRSRIQITVTPRKSTGTKSSVSLSPQVKKIAIEDAHPYDYPEEIRAAKPDDKRKTKYLGDLHANWVSLDMQLIHFGYIQQAKEKFMELCEVHKTAIQPVLLEKYIKEKVPGDDVDSVKKRVEQLDKAKGMYKKNLADVKEVFLNHTKVINKDLRLALGGDETADREGNDAYFMEEVEFLVDEGCQLDKILVSNHGIDFLYALKFKKCELYTGSHGLPFDTFSVATGPCNYSLQNLGKFIEWGIVSKERVTSFLDNYYIPRLILVDIIRDKERDDAVTIVTHASMWPTKKNPELFLKELFEKFHVECDLTTVTAKELVVAINQVNAIFRQLVMNEDAHEVLIKSFSDEDDILYKIIWNREKATPIKAQTHFKYSMVNGHDSALHEKELNQELEDAYICIDHESGKQKIAGDYPRKTIHSAEITSSETPVKKEEKKRRRMADIFPSIQELEARERSRDADEKVSARLGHAGEDQ